jgi:archaeosine synthase beta-subunit
VLSQAGARLLAYVLIKPLGLSEAEAVDDAVATARYVHEVAARHGVRARVAFQPVFVSPGSALEGEFLAGRYEPPSLWSVVEVVRRAHAHGELLVGLSDEGLEPRRLPSACPRCTPLVRAALARYNQTRDLAALAVPDCSCRKAP